MQIKLACHTHKDRQILDPSLRGVSMPKRSGADLLRERNNKKKRIQQQRAVSVGCVGGNSTEDRKGGVEKKKKTRAPRTPAERKRAMFEDVIRNDDEFRGKSKTAMDYGRLMVSCFWKNFPGPSFLQSNNIPKILKCEEPSFTEGVLFFMKREEGGGGGCMTTNARNKSLEQSLVEYRKERRVELEDGARRRVVVVVESKNKNVQCEAETSSCSTLGVVSSNVVVVKEKEEDVVVAPIRIPVRPSFVSRAREEFYERASLTVDDDCFKERSAVCNVVNKLTCGEVVFAIVPTAKNLGSVGSYKQERQGAWAHAGRGSLWAEVFVPSVDRIAQKTIGVGARELLMSPPLSLVDGMDRLHLTKVGEGKYSQIFAPSNVLASDRPVDLTGWPSMLVRVDKNKVRRPKNVVIRVPRLNSDDRTISDGSIAYAHEEAVNICEAAFAGFGPSVLAAFFIPEPDPPLLDEAPRSAFRFFTIMKRQSVSLEQRMRSLTGRTTTRNSCDSSSSSSSPMLCLSTRKPSGISQPTMRYVTMLLDTVFEYSVRGVVFLDASRGNFMDEENVFRADVRPADLQAVERVNVIDLDPRFYRRLDGASPESVWLFNTALVLAHIRRADVGRSLVPGILRICLHGSMSIEHLLCKVYKEQKSNPMSQWLFQISWNELPEKWRPDFESDWRVGIGPQIQQIVGYYFFYSERDGNGNKLLSAYENARRANDEQAMREVRSRFESVYVAGGGMHTARHFLYAATRAKDVSSVICALLMYVDSKVLLNRTELLCSNPYAPPMSLPVVGSTVVVSHSRDDYLGLTLKC